MLAVAARAASRIGGASPSRTRSILTSISNRSSHCPRQPTIRSGSRRRIGSRRRPEAVRTGPGTRSSLTVNPVLRGEPEHVALPLAAEFQQFAGGVPGADQAAQRPLRLHRPDRAASRACRMKAAVWAGPRCIGSPGLLCTLFFRLFPAPSIPAGPQPLSSAPCLTTARTGAHSRGGNNHPLDTEGSHERASGRATKRSTGQIDPFCAPQV
jgi:hypothetical protein